MTEKQIKTWIKEAHDNAVEKGFYPAGEDKNIGELLMLIVCEISEAVEAHRCGRFCKNVTSIDFILSRTNDFIPCFESVVKDTFEDELADVFIRLFDLCGYKNIYIDTINETKKTLPDNLPDCMIELVGYIKTYKGHYYPEGIMQLILNYLYHICVKFNIPIEKHITAKMEYNKTRPYKHGKEY